MIYAYKCRECGRRRESTRFNDIRPCSCGGLSKRDYSTVNIGGNGLVPHFNHSVGEYVSNNRQFEDALKRKQEDNSAKTGTDHSYVRVDPGDIPRPSADDYAFEVRAKTIRDKGIN